MQTELVVPIYLDTGSLLDLLASIEGGFSLVEKITSQNATSKASSQDATLGAGTEFGVPNVLSLLKINLGLSGHREKKSDQQEQREAERYHTYGSMFHRLREYLDTNQLIKRPAEGSEVWNTLRSSDFVEVHGVFRPNPLADSLGMIERLWSLVELAAPPASGQTRNKQSGKAPTSAGGRGASAQAAPVDMRKFLQGLLENLEKKNIRTFVVDLTGDTRCKAVAVLVVDYFRDKTLTEVSHKEYHLLGKVARKIEADGEESIDLLSDSALKGMTDSVLPQMVEAISNMPGLTMPKVETRIQGPALEIVPIAIFV